MEGRSIIGEAPNGTTTGVRSRTDLGAAWFSESDEIRHDGRPRGLAGVPDARPGVPRPPATHDAAASASIDASASSVTLRLLQTVSTCPANAADLRNLQSPAAAPKQQDADRREDALCHGDGHEDAFHLEPDRMGKDDGKR